MEKAAGAGFEAGVRWEYVLGCCAALLASAPGLAARAEEAGARSAEVLVAQARAETPVRLQLQTSTLPRFDAQDGGFQGSRVDLSLTPLNSAGSGLGAVLGMASPSTNPQALGPQARTTSIDLGLRWSQRLQSQRQVDITAWRRMNTPDDAYSMAQLHQPAVYGARVEMNLAAARKTSFALDTGFVGLQLESGARITIKRKDGRPMLYYRSTF
jgi:hypothetical protein